MDIVIHCNLLTGIRPKRLEALVRRLAYDFRVGVHVEHQGGEAHVYLYRPRLKHRREGRAKLLESMKGAE